MKAKTLQMFILVCLLIFGTTHKIFAYDAETHGLITYKAYTSSALAQSGPGSVVNRLGLDRLDKGFPFHIYWQSSSQNYYYDNAPTNDPGKEKTREPHEYERCQIQHLLEANQIPDNDPMVLNHTIVGAFPIQNWLIRGVLREDDVLPSDYKHSACGQPELDPYGPIRRVLNHFYDPVNDRELRPFGARCSDIPLLNISCTKSIDWAFGLVDSFANNPQVNMSRRNHFSYVDARENMWLALTGERGRAMAPYTAAERADDAQERLYRWATAFHSLGNVIHLLEDGAQPQHVRNDAHSPVLTSSEQQAYESYVNAQTQSQAMTDIRDLPGEYVRDFFNNPTDKTKLPALNTGSYPAVMFATPLRFFTTRAAGDTSTTLPSNRYGLLDYTNRSFFSGGTRPNRSKLAAMDFSAHPLYWMPRMVMLQLKNPASWLRIWTFASVP